jgi:hypothetical protein
VGLAGVVEEDAGWWTDSLAPLVAAAAGVGGVWIGHRLTRGRELRAVRLTAYVAWMTAVRNIAAWVGPEPQAGSVVVMPHPDRLSALNNASVGLGLVASGRVLKATRAYREALVAFMKDLGTQQATDVRQVIDVFEDALAPYRIEAVVAMRRDLIGGWRRWRAASPDESAASVGQ